MFHGKTQIPLRSVFQLTLVFQKYAEARDACEVPAECAMLAEARDACEMHAKCAMRASLRNVQCLWDARSLRNARTQKIPRQKRLID